jgi:hypothetical protein
LCLIKDILAKAQPEMALSILHISYFLQKCKKGKPGEIDLPLLKIAHMQSEPR